MNSYINIASKIINRELNSIMDLDPREIVLVRLMLNNPSTSLKAFRLIALSEPDLYAGALSAMRCPTHTPKQNELGLKKHAHLCGSDYCSYCGAFDPNLIQPAEGHFFSGFGHSKRKDRDVRQKAGNRHRQHGWMLRMPDEFCHAVTINIDLASSAPDAVKSVKKFKRYFNSKCKSAGFPFEKLYGFGRFEALVKPAHEFKDDWYSVERGHDVNLDSDEPAGMIHAHLLMMHDYGGVEREIVQGALSELFSDWFPGPFRVDVRGIRNSFVDDENRYNRHGVGGWLAYAMKGLKHEHLHSASSKRITIDQAITYLRLMNAVTKLRFELFPSIDPESYRMKCDALWCEYKWHLRRRFLE